VTRADAAASTCHELSGGWELAGTAPGERSGPDGLERLSWRAARAPGTVAGALAAAGGLDAAGDLDASDWWWRVTFDAAPAAPGEQVLLHLDGLATVAEVYLNGQLVLTTESMFARHRLDVGDRLRGENELVICLRALTPLLARRRTPRARWRTRLVTAGNLRFYRTMLLGRAPGVSPSTPVVGPWRPVRLERRSRLVCDGLRLRARVAGADGSLECRGRVTALGGGVAPDRLEVTLTGPTGVHAATLPVSAGGHVEGAVAVPAVARWWPHTHGAPSLYEVSLAATDITVHRSRIGFRTLRGGEDLEADGLALRINDVPVFARGAVWTPHDLRAPDATEAELRPALERVVAGGMNMLRLAGIGAYESDLFHDLCDELGILVWQDFMFANLDYPDQDPAFMAAVEAEGRALLDRLGPRPSLAAVCGGSEVAQQVAMLGLDPALAVGPLFGELLPRLVAEAEVDAPYIPHSPWGGELPFRPDRGIASYYGVGAYLRPLEDARRSEVRFAGECLAFANVPDEAALADLDAPGGLSVNHPAWKAGIPCDAGAGWDFEDVRNHYLQRLFGVDPVALRWVDQDRYLELSRLVSGEVMAETYGEWRRGASPCHGALVLWLRDLVPGAGWGVLDHRGEPKAAFHHLRRALAPVAVWSTDEGLGGVDVHVANDRPEPLHARLRVALYRDFETLVDETVSEVRLAAHTSIRRNVEGLLGRFVDVAWAYRFGPPAQDLIAVSLEGAEDGADGAGRPLVSQAFRFPAGRPLDPRPAAALGLAGALRDAGDGRLELRVRSTRFAYGVRVDVPGYAPADDAFGVEPGHERVVALSAGAGADGAPPSAWLTAANLAGRVRIESA